MSNQPCEGEAKDLLLRSSTPLVFHFTDLLKDWPLQLLTSSGLAANYPDTEVVVRVGQKDFAGIQWEADCDHIATTLEHVGSWLECSEGRKDRDELSPDNPLRHVNPVTHWAYCDYKHIGQLFPSDSQMCKDISWAALGFPEWTGADSTLWVGAAGAYTPGHQDAYGFNLVAQITGRKRWVLLPPESESTLHPTRVPYEESSVFSGVDLARPNLRETPGFKNCEGLWVRELSPGEVLLVPRGWWHHVSCSTQALSLNCWMPHPDDVFSRVKEAVVLGVMSSFGRDDPALLNPTQDTVGLPECVDLLNESLGQLISQSSRKNQSATPIDCQTTERDSTGDINVCSCSSAGDNVGFRQSKSLLTAVNQDENNGTHTSLPCRVCSNASKDDSNGKVCKVEKKEAQDVDITVGGCGTQMQSLGDVVVSSRKSGKGCSSDCFTREELEAAVEGKSWVTVVPVMSAEKYLEGVRVCSKKQDSGCEEKTGGVLGRSVGNTSDVDQPVIKKAKIDSCPASLRMELESDSGSCGRLDVKSELPETSSDGNVLSVRDFLDSLLGDGVLNTVVESLREKYCQRISSKADD